MTTMTESYLKVQYDLRPSKQVERRMIIDALQLLGMAGYPIRDYQYTGMGSIYFVDFIMFHKLLGIERLVSVEAAHGIQKRVVFNRPFSIVQIEMTRIGDYIPKLPADLRHILWLDYDSILSSYHLQDLALAGTYLPPGSIILATVDVEPPTKDGEPARWRDYFLDVAREYVEESWGVDKFARSNLIEVNATILERALRSGLSARMHIELMPIFSFDYADGHRMLTIGAIIGGKGDRRNLAASRLPEACYFRNDFKNPYSIKVPKITRKERLFLDSQMPMEGLPTRLDFEMSSDEVRSYSEIYRYFPAYAELLL